VRALEELFRGVLAWEPGERWTVGDLVGSEFMVRWALPVLERQRQRVGLGGAGLGRRDAAFGSGGV
jgi:hypothetical protein